MNKTKILLFIICNLCFLFYACMKDDMRAITEFDSGDKGVFIVCEGNFMYGNASLSYYDNIDNQIFNTVFLKANGFPLGDVAQSLFIHDSTAYVVINNSGKIYTFDTNNFKFKDEITNLVSPRYINFLSPVKAYISDLYSQSISIFNPQTLQITGDIPLNVNDDNPNPNASSEQFVFYNNYMFTNSWSYNNLIYVIDTENDKLVDSIKVLPQPRKILLDRNNYLWVLCDGGFDNSGQEAKSGIVKINTSNFGIEKTFLFEKNSNPVDMQINGRGDTVYYINQHVYRFSVNDTDAPQNYYINSDGRNLYALGVDPYNSDLYVADAVDFMQSGKIYRYSANKELIDEFQVGVIPNSFVFK